MKTSVVDIHKVKGVRPEYDVYIGRALKPFMDKEGEFTKDSKWANYYTFKEYGENALKFYEIDFRVIIERHSESYDLSELKGKRLGCWCITTDSYENPVCHGQILMKLIAEGVEK